MAQGFKNEAIEVEEEDEEEVNDDDDDDDFKLPQVALSGLLVRESTKYLMKHY